MQYRLLRNLKSGGVILAAGSLVDLSEGEAARLLDHGTIELANKPFSGKFKSTGGMGKAEGFTDRKLNNALKQLCTARDSFVAEINAVDGKIADCHATRHKLMHDPVSKSEYLGFVKAELDRRAAQFSEQLKRSIAAAPKGYSELKKALARGAGVNVNYLTEGVFPDRVTDAAILFYFGDYISSRFADSLNDLDWPNDAIPSAERDKLIASADAEIDKLTRQRDDLAACLASAGVVGDA